MKKNFSAYIEKHVYKFIVKHSLTANKKVLLSVSGGVDSMVLLSLTTELAKQFNIPPITVLTFDHGLRDNSYNDALFVKNECKRRGVRCEIHRLFLKTTSNVEHSARQVRQKIYQSYANRDYQVFLAHHINDAFEWYLLQSFKTSTPCYGIPVKNRHLSRPFLCLTRELIERYAKENSISYRHDQTNDDSRFERNFIRNQIIPKISEKYPQYLKAFVFRMNRLISLRKNDILNPSIKVIHDNLGGIVIQFTRADIVNTRLKEIFLKSIHTLSNKKRGRVMIEVDKLINALSKGKKGPMSFSGNVDCMLSSFSVYFYRKHRDVECDLSERRPIIKIEDIFKYPFIILEGFTAKKKLPKQTKFPQWLDIDTNDIIFTPELFSRIYGQQTINFNEVIDCNFRFVRLI